jgi:tetratricopeptide (TPR) repeat protein/TolB-like protein
VIHRDIKPENILLSGGHAVIADFGIARAITEAGGEQLTVTGISIGTPAYMSPEQASGEHTLDGRTDIYALGCVLYEMLAGEPPYTAPTAQALIAKKLSEATPHVAVVREMVPGAVDQALAKAMAKAPADRYSTVQEFANGLRTEAARPRRRWRSIALVVAAFLLAFVLIVLLPRVPWIVRPAAASFFDERDRVLIADFENETDQDALGLAVREAVITDLDQSPYANVVDRSELNGVLERMRLPDTTEISADVAVEIARREGYPAVVAGAVMQMGAGYQLSVRIIEASSGEVTIRLRETADGKEAVMGAVERLTRLARRHLGESMRSVRRSDPLPQVTTASLEALELAARARYHGRRGELVTAVSLLQEAIELDTAFAAAHRALGVYYGNSGDPAAAQRSVERAYRHSERLQPRERYLIASTYHAYRGRLDSAASYYTRVLERSPGHQAALNNLGDLYERMGRYEDALQLYQESAEGDGAAVQLLNVASAARTLGQHALADSALNRMLEEYPDTWMTWQTAAHNALYAGDEPRLEQTASDMSAHQSSYPRAYGTQIRAALHAMHGQLRAALALTDSSVALFIESGSELMPYYGLRTATWAAFAGGAPERARPVLRRMGDPSDFQPAPPFRHVALGFIAQVHALSGDVREATRLLAVMDSLVQSEDFHASGIGQHVRAIVALQDGRAEAALEHLRLAQAADYGLLHHPSRLLLGEAYAALGRLKEAAAQYDTLTSTYRLYFNDTGVYGPLRPIGHERAGALYLALGDTTAAIQHLATFVELWKNADSELQPMVRGARERLAELLGEPRR